MHMPGKDSQQFSCIEADAACMKSTTQHACAFRQICKFVVLLKDSTTRFEPNF